MQEEVQTIDGLRSMLRLGSNLAKDNTGTYSGIGLVGINWNVYTYLYLAVEETLNKVKSLLTVAQEWEQQAKSALKQKYVVLYTGSMYLYIWYDSTSVQCLIMNCVFCHRPSQTVEFFTAMLDESTRIPVNLPSVQTITTALEKAHNWNEKAQALQVSVYSVTLILCCLYILFV